MARPALLETIEGTPWIADLPASGLVPGDGAALLLGAASGAGPGFAVLTEDGRAYESLL